MTNVLAAIQVLSALLSLVARATAAANRITGAIVTARGQGRDISDQELADFEAESEQLGGKSQAALSEAAKR